MHVRDLPGLYGSARLSATLLQEDGGTPVVSAFGEVDLATFHDLDVLLMQAISIAGQSGYARHVVVDLRGVEFMDITGLRVLINGRNILSSASGGSLAVVCGERIGRLFEIAGLTEDFELYPNLGFALAEYPVGA